MPTSSTTQSLSPSAPCPLDHALRQAPTPFQTVAAPSHRSAQAATCTPPPPPPPPNHADAHHDPLHQRQYQQPTPSEQSHAGAHIPRRQPTGDEHSDAASDHSHITLPPRRPPMRGGQLPTRVATTSSPPTEPDPTPRNRREGRPNEPAAGHGTSSMSHPPGHLQAQVEKTPPPSLVFSAAPSPPCGLPGRAGVYRSTTPTGSPPGLDTARLLIPSRLEPLAHGNATQARPRGPPPSDHERRPSPSAGDPQALVASSSAASSSASSSSSRRDALGGAHLPDMTDKQLVDTLGVILQSAHATISQRHRLQRISPSTWPCWTVAMMTFGSASRRRGREATGGGRTRSMWRSMMSRTRRTRRRPRSSSNLEAAPSCFYSHQTRTEETHCLI